MSSPELSDLDYWRLCDELNIREAAVLIAGANPSEHTDLEDWEVHMRPVGYEAAKSAVRNALRSNRIVGKIEPDWTRSPYEQVLMPVTDSISLENSRVDVESLRQWLISRGFKQGFFFPEGVGSPDYLNPKDSRYAPKLAAAVRAWQAVKDPAGKHPKQALLKWLRENAAEFGLTDEEGKQNETGIEEAAKVANWQPGGGAPKTP